MKRFTTLLRPVLTAIAALALVAASAHAQNGSALMPSGTEYFIGFVQNDDETGGANAKFMGLMITSQVATIGIVEIPGRDALPFSTRPGEFTEISVPRAFEHTVSEDTIGDGTQSIVAAVRVTSRAPITVYVLNARHQTTAGYVAVPVSHWGTHYTPITLPNGLGKRTSELMIVSAYNDTYVRFTPAVNTVRQDRGDVREIKLDRGRTYFVQALAGAAGVADLSGSEIISTNPIGVISGHVRTPITLDGTIPSDPQAYATHQAAMLLPDSAWGAEFMSVPMRASGDRFRVMPSRQATIIITHYGPSGIGRDTLALDAGEVRDVSSIAGSALNGPVHWQSSAPAMVLQLRTGGRYGDPTESPAMLPLIALSDARTNAAFVAPIQIGGGVFTAHTLSIIAHLPSRHTADPVGGFGLIKIDSKPIQIFAPGGAPQRIGSTNYFHAKITVPAGGHTVMSSDGIAFIGSVGGDNGTINRDSYLWNLPSWGEPTALDADPPYVVSSESKSKGVVTVTASDRTDNYFSGVDDIQPAPESSGWIRTSFNSPYPEDDAIATFRTTADPSGPLNVIIRDRDGNVRSVQLNGSVCFKTAIPSAMQLTITNEAGKVGKGSIDLTANSCGDEAHVSNIVFGSGLAALHLTARFDNGLTTITIPSTGRATLNVTTSTTLPIGHHETTMRIAIDDSIATIAVSIDVEPPSSAPLESDAGLAISIFPNPVTARTTIAIARPLGNTATISITDNLGRIVRTFPSSEVAGRARIEWDARGDDGGALAAGSYMVVVTDGRDRIVSGVSLVR